MSMRPVKFRYINNNLLKPSDPGDTGVNKNCVKCKVTGKGKTGVKKKMCELVCVQFTTFSHLPYSYSFFSLPVRTVLSTNPGSFSLPRFGPIAPCVCLKRNLRTESFGTKCGRVLQTSSTRSARFSIANS